MSSKLKRKLIVFNEDDTHQRELLAWVASRTNNFSGFVKDILFAFKTGSITQVSAVQPMSVVDTKLNGIGDIF